ncbi:MAG: hypothetical protein RMK34_10620 [Tepidimonas sp.]|uniref:hypothetical protein n=1 Tax=Tepidimonas sp. TaxID=2002775 RepID=UPI00298F1971|nr:hypothetical protein [Tepidimonas sp.]MCS6810580.1 hypothetical protein [Tepidimonas sp.]MDW8337403.1 hypothetical protein [Tepidimonas sp.]
MNRRTRWALGALGGMLGLAALGWLAARPQAVRTAPVQRGDIVQAVVVSGRVEAVARIDVGAEVTATVPAVLVREGEAVRAGQPLVLLADDEARAAVAQAR